MHAERELQYSGIRLILGKFKQRGLHNLGNTEVVFPQGIHLLSTPTPGSSSQIEKSDATADRRRRRADRKAETGSQ